MMKKVSILLLVLMFVVGLSVSAYAYPSLPTYWKLKFEDFEWLAPPILPAQDIANGVEDNWGIFKVTSIIDRFTVNTTWSDGQGGWQITGMFYNIDIDDVAVKGVGYTVNSTNRVIQPMLNLYIQNVADIGYTNFNPSLGLAGRTGVSTYTTATDGTLLVSSNFMPGILPIAFPLPYVDGAPFDPVDTVINLDLDALTSPMTGDGAGYLDVIAGSGPWAGIMDTNSFALMVDSNNDGIPDLPMSRDVFFEFDFRPHPDPGLPNWGWTVNSDDPAIGKVPEPGTLMLLGAGLFGVGIFARRRMK